MRARAELRPADRAFIGALARLLPHDATVSFGEVFRSEGIRVVPTPVRAPQANAHAERFVRPVRTECLDWLLILRQRHLERVLSVYTAHYSGERPHHALALGRPKPPSPNPSRTGLVSPSEARQIALSLLQED
jgi:transposase InsO family protein